MDLLVGKIIEKVSEGGYENKKFIIKKLKMISGNIHAVISDVSDENSEILVALSVLEDKNKFKLQK